MIYHTKVRDDGVITVVLTDPAYSAGFRPGRPVEVHLASTGTIYIRPCEGVSTPTCRHALEAAYSTGRPKLAQNSSRKGLPPPTRS